MLRIYGQSDDNVCANIELQCECPHCGQEIEEPSQAVVSDREDEIGAYNKIVTFVIGDDKGGVAVDLEFEESGIWSAKFHQLGVGDDGVPIPWPITVFHGDDDTNSVVVYVDCPNGTPVKVKKRRSG